MTPSTPAAPTYRVSIRLYVLFSLLTAVSAATSGLVLLFLARPYISDLTAPTAWRATVMLFSGAALSGGLAALVGLVFGLRFQGRIRGIVRKAEAIAPPGADALRVTDDLGALDAAVGRLSLSMDRFVRDSDILTRLPEGMLLLGPRRELLSYNTTAEVILELTLEQYKAMSILAQQGPFPGGAANVGLSRLLDEAAAGERSVRMSEVAVATSRGRRMLLEMTVQHREWGQDSSALVLLFQDATEKRRIREEIRKADQLALLGGMAARVAHEIRTPLATIRGLVELLQADVPEGDSRAEYITRMIQAVDRQDQIVEKLLTLSRPEPDTWQPVGLGELLADVLRMLPVDPRLRAPAPASGLPPVWGDPVRLGEVFTNLIRNALEAIPPTGVVEVTVSTAPRERLRVIVRNTGTGIPLELRERIFQPFYTTKQRGTGLGLAISRQIVEAHRGTLTVLSDGSTETSFVVEMPTTRPADEAPRERTRVARGTDG
jgi:signal transduction histidine kinase